MNRFTIIAISLLSVMIVLTACNDDGITRISVEDSSTGEASKRGLDLEPAIDDPPLGYDQYYAYLSMHFGFVSWMELKFPMMVKTGGEHVVELPGYDGYYVTITFEGDPTAVVQEQEGIIWIPAEPAQGQYVDIVGDCIIYRTSNIPPDGIEKATIKLPIMPWYRTDGYDGQFQSYDLGMNDFGYPAPFNVKNLDIPWPPEGPETEIHVELEVLPDKDDPSNIVDRVVDPELGNEN